MRAFLKGISYYLPEKVRSNKEISQSFPDWPEEKILSKIGIAERHIAAEDEFASDIAIKACENLFSERNIKK